MENSKQEQAVVISLDAYRERRRLQSVPVHSDSERERPPVLMEEDRDEYAAEERLRLLTKPMARRPDERELL